MKREEGKKSEMGRVMKGRKKGGRKKTEKGRRKF